MSCFCSKLVSFVLLIMLNHFQSLVGAVPQVPCYFIFGDSLVDNGNNNGLITTAKANYQPYGIDFVNGATGRFTNGQTSADFIGSLLGFTSFIPSYASGQDITRGVNYGSGGAGIRDETGIFNLGGRISLDKQLLNHKSTTLRLTILQRNLTFTKEYLKKCIYTVGMGSNDYINNYFIPLLYLTSRLFTTDRFAAALINQYSKQLRTLYNLGARKVAIFGLGLIGCTPAEISRFGTNGTACVDAINNAVQLFNNRLKPLVDDLNTAFPDAKFTYINITSITSGDPSAAGITVVNAPCCIVRTDGLCSPNTVPCSNRTQYAFYDGFHPTEIVNFFAALRAYNALLPIDAYPIDINHLAQL